MEDKLPFEKIERKILIKSDDFETNPGFGFYPDKRPIQKLIDYGIVNVDKPQGPTSHQVSDYVKKILHIDKAGHSGTLDPNVTGCLPVALSKGTRVVSALLIAGKEYVCIMHVHEVRSEEETRNAINKYVGKIRQLPPVKSAVKREWRTREVYYIDIIEIDGQDVLFKVGCEAGTYIRKLCTDIGKEMNCGAHMVELRRTKAGPFNVEHSVTLTSLMDAYAFFKENNDESYLRKCVLPFENAISHLGKIYVFDTTIDTLCHGAPLNVPGIAKLESGIEVGDSVAVLSLKGELVCIGDSKMNSNDIFKNNHGCVISMMSVFMPDGTYPKYKREVKEEVKNEEKS
jgi:H/ACA ribonucleoprotein complex subunit 4